MARENRREFLYNSSAFDGNRGGVRVYIRFGFLSMIPNDICGLRCFILKRV